MNDYQMTKLSHGRFTELRAEAQMSHLAAQAKMASHEQESAPRAPGRLRARISLLFSSMSDWGTWGSAEWDAGLHRRGPRGF